MVGSSRYGQIFKGSLPQILLGLLLNTWTHICFRFLRHQCQDCILKHIMKGSIFARKNLAEDLFSWMAQYENFARTCFRELRKKKKFPSIFQKTRFNIWKKNWIYERIKSCFPFRIYIQNIRITNTVSWINELIAFFSQGLDFTN